MTIRRELAAHDPAAYRAVVASTLNNFGNLFRNTGRLAEADKAYSEALTIYRELASSNPKVYAGRIAALTQLLTTVRKTSPSLPSSYPAASSLH